MSFAEQRHRRAVAAFVLSLVLACGASAVSIAFGPAILPAFLPLHAPPHAERVAPGADIADGAEAAVARRGGSAAGT